MKIRALTNTSGPHTRYPSATNPMRLMVLRTAVTCNYECDHEFLLVSMWHKRGSHTCGPPCPWPGIADCEHRFRPLDPVSSACLYLLRLYLGAALLPLSVASSPPLQIERAVDGLDRGGVSSGDHGSGTTGHPLFVVEGSRAIHRIKYTRKDSCEKSSERQATVVFVSPFSARRPPVAYVCTRERYAVGDDSRCYRPFYFRSPCQGRRTN
jgi:hypothetical protein